MTDEPTKDAEAIEALRQKLADETARADSEYENGLEDGRDEAESDAIIENEALKEKLATVTKERDEALERNKDLQRMVIGIQRA